MKPRPFVTILATGAALASLWAVLAQRRELAPLRADQHRLELASQDESTAAGNSTVSEGQEESVVQPKAVTPEATSLEVLRLRNQVTQLRARQRELAGMPEENKRLQAQLKSAPAQRSSGMSVPHGYIRKSQARMAGYATPEDTIQTFLWALQHQDFNRLLQSLTPSAAQHLEATIQSRGETRESFLKTAEVLPGLAIHGQQSLPDGAVELNLVVATGAPTNRLTFQLINGEWKMASPF